MKKGPGERARRRREALRGAAVGATVLSVLVASLMVIPARAAAQESGIEVGAKAPAAVLETLAGKRVDLADYIGKTPVLIEFWATWCPNCKELEKPIEAAHRKYGKEVRFLGVAVSVNQSPERVRVYAQRHKLPLEVLFDRRGNATAAYDVPATSYVVVIDRSGTIVYTGLGGDQDIEGAIRRAGVR
jgi:peroxiredoxin